MLGASFAPRAAAQTTPPADSSTDQTADTSTADAARPEDDSDIVVTALRRETKGFDTPASVSSLDKQSLRTGPDSRNLPNNLAREPSVLLQKTGPGQSSPFVRGFTGFRTLLLVDGVRINNSVWRDGPNQYTATVDNFSIDFLELVRGPSSVLWGSDAIGGTFNARTTRARVGGPPGSQATDGEGEPTSGWGGAYQMRAASAERSFFHRLEFEGGEADSFAVKGGVTNKSYGTLHAGRGSGDLRGTAWDEHGFDVRVDIPAGERVDLTVVAQRVRQEDVPRTHRTIDAKSFHSSSVGTEIERDLDQDRDLVYLRATWEPLGDTFYDEASATVSYQRHEEEQERLRTGNRFDRRGFDVETLGAQIQLSKDTSAGLLTFGVESFHDDVDSFREDFVGGVLTGPQIQGSVGDDSKYHTLGVYVQDEIVHGDFETTLGVRWSRASAESDAVDNPNVAGSDPTTPGNILTVNETWNELTGSVRTLHHVSPETNVYAGLSQGFRAPNLSDLTADLEDSGIESPTPDLDPEHFLALEVGARTRNETSSGEATVYYTWVRDLIVRSPTGQVVAGTPVVQKSNVGDGFIWGVELRGETEIAPEWTAFAVATYQKGRVDEFTPDGRKVDKPISRSMPPTGVVGVTYDPADEPWFVTADVLMADDADDLSLRDQSDTERIPPGGTPGYGVLGVRSKVALDEASTLGLAVENVLDKDYRVHGSGQNEPGRNVVLTYRREF